MRTVTLGALIVTGGTLAALPFRRTVDPSNELQPPALASGPARSSLREINPQRSDFAAESTPAASASAHTTFSVISDRAEDGYLASPTPHLPWNPPAARQNLNAHRPLTYRDLAGAVIPSPTIENRFSAAPLGDHVGAAPRGGDGHKHATTVSPTPPAAKSAPLLNNVQPSLASTPLRSDPPSQTVTPSPRPPERSPQPTEPHSASVPVQVWTEFKRIDPAANEPTQPTTPARSRHWIQQPTAGS